MSDYQMKPLEEIVGGLHKSDANIIVLGWMCSKNEPEVDVQKLALLAGISEKSAANAFEKAKTAAASRYHDLMGAVSPQSIVLDDLEDWNNEAVLGATAPVVPPRAPSRRLGHRMGHLTRADPIIVPDRAASLWTPVQPVIRPASPTLWYQGSSTHPDNYDDVSIRATKFDISGLVDVDEHEQEAKKRKSSDKNKTVNNGDADMDLDQDSDDEYEFEDVPYTFKKKAKTTNEDSDAILI